MIGWALLWCSYATAQTPQVTANVNARRVALGEQVVLRVQVSNGAAQPPPAIPRIPNVTVSGPNKQNQVRIVNGRRTSTETYVYVLTPTKLGKFTIPVLRVQVGQRIYGTPSFVIDVVASTATSTLPDPVTVGSRRPRA